MKRLDLIIDALEMASHVPKGVVYPAGYPMQIAQALTAARELRGMKPVGVFEYDKENNVWEELTPNCEGVRLYDLGDEK